MIFKRTILTIFGIFGSVASIVLLALGNVKLYVGASPEKEQLTDNVIQESTNKDIKEELSFPYSIEGTDLLIERVVSYDGPFIEDDSNREMNNITAILLRNTGDTGIAYARIAFVSQDTVYYFFAEDIPANSSALVLDSEGKQFRREGFYYCVADAQIDNSSWLKEEYLQIETVGMDTISITNITEKPLLNVQIYYKNDYASGRFCLGGRAHKAVVESIAPGETLQIKPAFFAGPHSRILRICLKEE